jgi:hypothetical protein
VRFLSELALGYANIRVVLVVAERAKDAIGFVDGCHFPRDDYDGGRIEVVEQTSERRGSNAGTHRYIPDDRELIILRHLRSFDLGDSNSPSATSVAFDEIFDGFAEPATHDHAVGVSELSEERLESSGRFLAVLKDVVRPGDDDRFDCIELQE